MKRLIVWWYSYRRGGSSGRSHLREIRKELIKNNKREIMRDLMTGHNVGDFEMSKDDLNKFLKMEENPPYTLLHNLYKTYRGNDLRYIDFN